MNDLVQAELILLAQNTENQSRDLLVAIVAIGLGLNILYAAVTDNARCFELASVRTMERSVGRPYTKLILIGIGSLCLFMGAWLVAQSTLRKSASSDSGVSNTGALVGVSTDLN